MVCLLELALQAGLLNNNRLLRSCGGKYWIALHTLHICLLNSQQLCRVACFKYERNYVSGNSRDLAQVIYLIGIKKEGFEPTEHRALSSFCSFACSQNQDLAVCLTALEGTKEIARWH